MFQAKWLRVRRFERGRRRTRVQLLLRRVDEKYFAYGLGGRKTVAEMVKTFWESMLFLRRKK